MPYFNHEKLIVYQKAIEFVTWSGNLLQRVERKAAARDHLLRASSAVPVNIATGNSRESRQARSQLFEIASGSALECAACLDVLVAKGCFTVPDTVPGKETLRSVVSMLVALRQTEGTWGVKEEEAPYGKYCFGHESLDLYQRGLWFISWCEQLSSNNELRAETRDNLDRSSTSVVLNVAEGNGKFSPKDRSRFLDIAHTSSLRCASFLDVWAAGERLSQEQVAPGKSALAEIVAMIFGLKKRIESDASSDDSSDMTPRPVPGLRARRAEEKTD